VGPARRQRECQSTITPFGRWNGVTLPVAAKHGKDYDSIVRANVLNYIAAAVFFAAAIRDWFFPGVLQMARHPARSEEAVVWVVMGCTCMAAALARSRRARSERRL
jgi:hypothetical protein